MAVLPKIVLPKLLPNPIQSQERTLSADTLDSRDGFSVNFWFFCLPARYYREVMGEAVLGTKNL
jgi:hypothetical protein